MKLQTPKIENVIESIRQDPKNQGAWAEFYTYFHRQIAGMFFMLGIRDNEEIKELCQEVFYRFLKYSPWSGHWRTLPEARKLLAYLRVVSRNALYSSYHKNREVNLPSDQLEEKMIAIARLESGKELQEINLNENLSHLMEGLSKKDRELLGGLIEGQNLREIAEMLGISYTSAGVRLHRLRKKIRRSGGIFR